MGTAGTAGRWNVTANIITPHTQSPHPADQDVQEFGHLTPCHETCMYHFLLSKE